MKASTLPLILIILAVSTFSQGIPQIQPINTTLGTTTDYILNYFSLKNIPSTTIFTIDFSNTDIQITEGQITCTASLNDVQTPSPYCICSGTTCQLKPNKSAPYNTKVFMQFSGLKNPLYLSTQKLSVNIFFNPTITQENYDVSIPYSAYQTMGIIVNSFEQTDYGVGSTPVTYIFNISLHYISENFQLQIQIPEEVGYSSISSSMSFYGTIQNISPFQIQSLLIFNIQTPEIQNPDGFMLLNLTGFANPQYIGTSSSFGIVFQETKAQANCATCKIAQLSEGVIVESKTPGDIKILGITSTNLFVASSTTFSISLQLYAGVPEGGKIFIDLPSEIEPVMPVICKNVYGFTLSTGKTPLCTYDEQNHRIQTQNFASPYDIEIGNAIISIEIYNAYDSRSVLFSLETTDEEGRTIGKTRNPQAYSAIPISMNSIANKSNVQVGSEFIFYCQITLQKQIDSTNTIEVIFPSGVEYDTDNIKCISAGQDLSCTKSQNTIGQLVLTMAPPCVKCSNGDKLSFSINNLRNPSFINDDMEIIYIHTKTENGIIEASEYNINLSPANIDLLQYNRLQNQKVGQEYDYQIKFNPPTYTIEKGGQVHILFQKSTVYADVQIQTSSYDMVYSLVVEDGQNNDYDNSIQYYTDITPPSIKKIIFNICENSACTSNTPISFLIKGFKQSYIPGIQAQENIKICTLLGQQIAEKTIDTSLYAPILNSDSIAISLSQSMTNTRSDYEFTIEVPEIVIDNLLQIQLPLGQVIHGSCSLSVNQYMTGTYSCEKVDDRNIKIIMDYDQNLMISQTIKYVVKIEDVKTPTSRVPLRYSINTKYNNIKNQQFSNLYSVDSPFPLQAQIQKSNNTINEDCNIKTTIVPQTTDYETYKFEIPVSIIEIEKSEAEAIGFSFTKNSTYYILTQSNKMEDNEVSIAAKNTISTVDKGQIILTTLKQGYQVQRSSISIGYTEPITLGLQASSSNSTVGILTNLTITIDRNNEGWLGQTQIIITLPSNAFSYEEALYGENPVDSETFLVSVPILVSSQKIMVVNITNVKNILYVPNAGDAFQNLRVEAVKLGNQLVGQSEIDVKYMVSDDPYDIDELSAARNVTKSADFTGVQIEYTTILGKTGDLIQFTLPQNQNEYLGSSSCMQGTPGSPDYKVCTIISSNTSVITVVFEKDTLYTLTNILNYHPNANDMFIRILTEDNQVIEQSSTHIFPDIMLEELHVEIIPTTKTVASVNTLIISLKSVQLSIEPSHKLTIDVPQQSFSRKLNTEDCSIQVSGNVYTGCNYIVDGEGWLTQIQIPTLSPFTIQVNTSIIIRVEVTNGWSAYPFNNKKMVFHFVNADESSLSEGKAPLVEVFSLLSTFELQKIKTSSLSQSMLQANEQNNLTLDINFEGNYKKGSQFIVMIPRDTYEIQQGGDHIQYFKEDSLYYYVKQVIHCEEDVCVGDYLHSEVLSVKNDKFVKNNRNKIMSYIMYEEYPVTQFASIEPEIYTPQNLKYLAVERTNNNAYEQVQMTVQFKLDNIFNTLNIEIDNYLASITSATFKQMNSQAELQAKQIDSFSFTSGKIECEVPANSSDTVRLSFSGKNSLLVPINEQVLQIKVFNQTHTLYLTQAAKFQNSLVPYNNGLTISRQQTTVGLQTKLTLSGSLPEFDLDWNNCVVEINETSYQNSISSNVIDIGLNNYINPESINGQGLSSCKIVVGQYIVYENANQQIEPSLQSITATSSEVSIEIPTLSYINEEVQIIVKMSNPQKAQKLQLSFPIFFDFVQSCVGYLNKTSKISSYSLITSQNSLKVITINNPTEIELDEFRIRVNTVAYQTLFEDEQITLNWETPSTLYRQQQDIFVYGIKLQSEIQSSSLKTKESSTYSIKVSSLGKEGEVRVILPKHISDQIQYMPSNSIKVSQNGEMLTSGNYELVLESELYSFIIPNANGEKELEIILEGVVNPISNEPQIFKFEQRQVGDELKIYGYEEKTITMEELDEITVTKAHRNTSKIGQSIQIQMHIECPNYEEVMFIEFPITQVIVNTEECLLTVDEVETQCSFFEGNIIKTTNKPGNHTYLLKSVNNAEYSQSPSSEDKVKVWLGEPYEMAQTKLSTSVHLTPLIVTGSIEMIEVKSTNNKRSQYTELTYKLKTQNWQSCDGLIIIYSELSYWTHRNMECRVNGQLTTYMLINSNSIYIEIGELRSQTMTLKINNIINYLQNGPFTMNSVKRKSPQELQQQQNNLLQASFSPQAYEDEKYGILDSFNSGQSVGKFTASSPKVRIILPNNYVSDESKTIIAINDGDIAAELPVNTLFYSFESTDLGCSKTNIEFAKQIKMNCKITVSGDITFTVTLYDQKALSSPLTQVSKSIYIYVQPTNSCVNALCDLCSQQKNIQYCFECREELVSSDGTCVEECPTSTVSYEQVCVDCAPQCSDCYDIYDENCLQCSDQSLVLDSGTCRDNCLTGYEYEGNCVSDEECTTEEGCRTCSNTGFCYECLPDYDGQPQCSLQQLLPPLVFSYLLIPLLGLLFIFPAILACQYGCSTVPYMIIFFTSLIEFVCWVFTIPRVPEQVTAMVLCSFVLLRIILSIVSYETYYNKHITKRKETSLLKRQSDQQSSNQSDKKEEQVNEENNDQVTCKERTSRFFSHFLNVDSYELLQTMYSKPFIGITHHNAYLGFSIANRVLVMVLMVYILTYGKVGDLLILPLASLTTGFIIIIIRTIKSHCFQTCLNKIRS